MGNVSGQWGGLRTGWTVRPRRLSSTAQRPAGGQPIVVTGRGQYCGPQCLTILLITWMMGCHPFSDRRNHISYHSYTPSGCPLAVMQPVFQTCDPEHIIPSLLFQLFLAWLWCWPPKFKKWHNFLLACLFCTISALPLECMLLLHNMHCCYTILHLICRMGRSQ